MLIKNFKIWVIVLSLSLLALILFFAISLYRGSCSYLNNCMEGGRARAVHTPIPTLIPVSLPVEAASFPGSYSSDSCSVTAKTLLSAWIGAGYPENDPFQFSDSTGVACEGTFADIQSLLMAGNLWYPGALACAACHNAALAAASSAQLDLSSYAGILAGANRAAGSLTGRDILGAGSWQDSILNRVLFVDRTMPVGRPLYGLPAFGPLILAGIPISIAHATPAPTPAQPEIARPSNSGDAGDAINLTGDPLAGTQVYLNNCQMCHGSEGKGGVLNPGTDDGTVPPLNPIDSTLMDADYRTYAYNLDLFLQNGSTPGGVNPSRLMPPWGAQDG